MSDLESIFFGLGFTNVQIYIRTGNIVFLASHGTDDELIKLIENRLTEDLGHDIRVLLRSPQEISALVRHNPFVSRGADPKKLHVTFLSGAPDADLAVKVDPATAPPDEFEIAGRDVYLHCPEGYGRGKLGNAFWERRLKTVTTTRNWNTVTKLLELSSVYQDR